MSRVEVGRKFGKSLSLLSFTEMKLLIVYAQYLTLHYLMDIATFISSSHHTTKPLHQYMAQTLPLQYSTLPQPTVALLPEEISEK
jgi:hypothetical protein